MKCIEQPPTHLTRSSVVALDVEWTKNFRIQNGNRPFCFSLAVFETDVATRESLAPFGFWSFYVDAEDEQVALADAAGELLGEVLGSGATLIGHQLWSDLAVLAGVAGVRRVHLKAIQAARSRWRTRQQQSLTHHGAVFDTRYDLPVAGKSRRLVDVCEEHGLDVFQPELRGSMTRMQRDFLRAADETIRERLAVLNLRHSVSSALLYLLRDSRRGRGQDVNVNRLLHAHAGNAFSYVRSSAFARLL